MISLNPSMTGISANNRTNIMNQNNISFKSQEESKADKVDLSKKESSNKTKNILMATVLLAGGAALGYGHRKYITQGLDFIKDKTSQFLSQGLPAELLQKGKALLDKVKGFIFVQK